VMAPKNKWELSDMMKFAVEYSHPIAVRYPRGEAYDGLKECRAPIVYGKSEVICEGSRVALFALGSMVKTAESVSAKLREQGIECTIVNARFAVPFDRDEILRLSKNHELIVTLEENIQSGGMGEHIQAFANSQNIKATILPIAAPNTYVQHGKVDRLLSILKMDADSIVERIMEVL